MRPGLRCFVGYDNLNHLIWAKDSATDGGAATSLATYVYDVFGDRIEKDLWSSGTTTILRFAYDLGGSSPSAGDDLGSAGNLWADLNGSGSLLERYILGDSVDQLFARIFSTGTAAWYLTDRLGSVRDIIDNTGAVIDHLNYDGFGNVTSETEPWNGDRFKWTGRELDSETGLQYNRARYYDPKTGRWTSQDPAGFTAGDANLYRYVTNDTPNATDPSGLYGPGPVITDVAAYAAAMQQRQQNYATMRMRNGYAASRRQMIQDRMRQMQRMQGERALLNPNYWAEFSSGVREEGVGNMGDTLRGRRQLPPPGYIEGMIPVWASVRRGIYYWQNGHPWLGGLYIGMAYAELYMMGEMYEAYMNRPAAQAVQSAQQQLINRSNRINQIDQIIENQGPNMDWFTWQQLQNERRQLLQEIDQLLQQLGRGG